MDCRKDLLSILNSPFRIDVRLFCILSGAISVRNPRLPKFIPNIGIPFIPYFLAVFMIVPSPPIEISKSQFFSIWPGEDLYSLNVSKDFTKLYFEYI